MLAFSASRSNHSYMNVEDETNLMDIHTAFSETEYGQTLAAQVRYDRYKPADVSNERWVELLGPDVNNLTHLPLTYALTQGMIRQMEIQQPGFINEEEAELLKTAALIHDWAEALVGDTTYSDKTNQHEEEEKVEFANILSSLEHDEAAELSKLIARAADEVVFSPDTKLGKIFNTVERIGYVRTAVRAGKQVMEGTAPECREGLEWLIADVMGNHIEVLIDRIKTHLPAYAFLSAQSDEILDAFAIVDSEVFMHYSEDQQEPKRQAFYQTKALFKAWFV
jgi:hypothetical protein